MPRGPVAVDVPATLDALANRWAAFAMICCSASVPRPGSPLRERLEAQELKESK